MVDRDVLLDPDDGLDDIDGVRRLDVDGDGLVRTLDENPDLVRGPK